ncbi:MAG: nitrate reductase molybdenum cofactor assembly chaperone [Acidobacteriota bacterium]|nr:nitrate reductase molybdenum cofactor assembly chaperone [Acidobacteriota bacterium]
MTARARHHAATATTHKLCSLMLSYPDAELLAARRSLAGAVAQAQPQRAREALERFCGWWVAREPLALAQHYVETFDLDRRCSLYLTFYAEGDKRSRGAALLRLKRMYRAAGLPLAGSELPDHLPSMLEFAADVPDGRGLVMLREHRAAIELLRLSLRDRGTPYADVLEAVHSALGELPAAERARALGLAAGGPPQELVGLEPFAPPEVMPVLEARR